MSEIPITFFIELVGVTMAAELGCGTRSTIEVESVATKIGSYNVTVVVPLPEAAVLVTIRYL